MARRNTSLQRRMRRDLDLWVDPSDRPKVIEWADLAPLITEERRQANLARASAIRAALHSYLVNDG